MSGPGPAAASAGASPDRATSAVVGVVLLVGLTVLLTAGVSAFVAFGQATTGQPPQVHVSGTLSATDGWPDGQRLRLVHEAGDALDVDEIALAVDLPRAEGHARLSGFPTRRLTDEHVSGRTAFDRTYAGVDGELDAAHTDGRWASGETTSIRIAQAEVDVREGDRAVVRVVHLPTGAVLARVEVVAS